MEIPWRTIIEQIPSQNHADFTSMSPKSISGGCINQAFKLTGGQQTWFIKINTAASLGMFESEAAGLKMLAGTQTLRTPQILGTGIADTCSYIAMEYIKPGKRTAHSQILAGKRLAAMHQCQQKPFGWSRDNTIGSTRQPNTWRSDWVEFWRKERLGFQLQLAARKGYGGRLQKTGEQLLSRFAALIDHAPCASLLHGDLWGGNILFDRQGDPVIFDPATYYGDREADIAMTELFGGFNADFYAAYQNIWPLDSGYAIRKTLYNLYHILNHMNLFGGSYYTQAQNMLDRLLAEC